MDSHASQATCQLLLRYQRGDADALDALVQRYYPRVKRIVAVRLGATLRQRESVDDVVQDVFVRIVKSAPRYQAGDDGSWIDYVARMVENEISNHARRGRSLKRGGNVRTAPLHSESATAEGVMAHTTEVFDKAARTEDMARVDECLSALDKDQREVILLRDYAGCSWQAVAERMGRVSPEACQELRRRARRELGARLSSARQPRSHR